MNLATDENFHEFVYPIHGKIESSLHYERDILTQANAANDAPRVPSKGRREVPNMVPDDAASERAAHEHGPRSEHAEESGALPSLARCRPMCSRGRGGPCKRPKDDC